MLISHDDKILVIIGPSGTGKSTIVQKLQSDGLIEVTPTWTTRPPREHELLETVEHCFVNQETFDAQKAASFFLDTVQVFNLPYQYGIPELTTTNESLIPTIMLRAPLVERVPTYYANFIVYHIESDQARVREALHARTQAGEPIGNRLDDYQKEVLLGRSLAHRVFINISLQKTIKEITQALSEDFTA